MVDHSLREWPEKRDRTNSTGLVFLGSAYHRFEPSIVVFQVVVDIYYILGLDHFERHVACHGGQDEVLRLNVNEFTVCFQSSDLRSDLFGSSPIIHNNRNTLRNRPKQRRQ